VKFDLVQLLGALAIFIPAVLGAWKTFRSSGDADKRLSALEDWQKQQDGKLQSIKDDQKREFENAGKHRYRMDKHLALLENRARETGRRVENIPTRSEHNYRREAMEYTPSGSPLPTVAPPVDPVTERTERPDPDDYPGLLDEFKPKRRKR
jgi:hypothetical protein